MPVVITMEQVHSTFMSSQWREAAEEMAAAFGATVSVVDTTTGATVCSGAPPCVCSALFGGEPMAGLSCVHETDGDLDCSDRAPRHGRCAAGLGVVIAPVRFEGIGVCHVMLCGFLVDERDRRALVERVKAAGRDAADARALADRVAAMSFERADAAARTVVALAEGMLASRVSVDVRAARGCEMAMLAEVTRDLGLSDLVRGRLPEGPLRSLMRLTGADHAVTQLPAAGSLDDVVTTLTGDVLDDASAGLAEGAARHVRETGRPHVTSGTIGRGRRMSVLSVPFDGTDPSAGLLTLAKIGGEPLSADDVRLAVLFADTVGAMRVTASDAMDANMKLLELAQVNEVARLLNSTLDGDRLAEIAVEVLSKTLVFGVGGFVVDGFGERRGRIVHLTDIGSDELEALVADAWGADPSSDLLRGVDVVGRSSVIADTAPTRARDWKVLSRDLRFRNMRAGQLFVASLDPQGFRADDERVLDALAAHLSIALENACVYSRLGDDFRRAISALAALADATERLDRGHTDRVMDYAVSLGEEMGLSPESVGLLRFAGLLHDLGKVGVAEEILIKPATLSEEEMAIVRRHSEMGATIIEQVQMLEAITPIVRHHHEHWDGHGYPDGLAGEGIPREARILAVADAFEAMTGQRHHRKRMTVSAARREIERGSGTQFDPEVVRAFLSLLSKRALLGATGAYVDLATGRHERRLPA